MRMVPTMAWPRTKGLQKMGMAQGVMMVAERPEVDRLVMALGMETARQVRLASRTSMTSASHE